MFERLDDESREVMRAAYEHAVHLDDHSIGTEHLLLGLAATNTPAGELLARAGADAKRLQEALSIRPARRPRSDQASLLATLGIDLAAIRVQAQRNFGPEAVTRAATLARPRRRRSFWSRVSCSTPQTTRCDSPLAGDQLAMIPRVKRLLHRATNDAKPHQATPAHLLLAMITGDEPANEVLQALGVRTDQLAAEARQLLRRD